MGHWTIDGACVDPDALNNSQLEQVKAVCPNLTYQTSYDASGTADFTAASYTFDMQITVTANAHVPASCFAGTGLTCATLGPFITQLIGGDTGTTIGCTGSSDCNCALVAPQARVESGTYTTATTILTTTPSGSPATSTPYCVDGSALHVITLGTNGSIVSDIVGQR